MNKRVSRASRQFSTVSELPVERVPSVDFLKAKNTAAVYPVKSVCRIQAGRGGSHLERKSSWPFDYYQAGAFFPVDYHYYQTAIRISTGHSVLVMMHAMAYTSDRTSFGADQVAHRGVMKDVHRTGFDAFMESLYK